MKKTTFLSIAALLVTSAGFAAGFSTAGPGEKIDHTIGLPEGGTPITITQSTDTATITALNSISCNAGGLHTDNSYIRRFDLDGDHGILSSFDVESVDFGVETAAGAGGAQPVDVNLYSIAAGDPLLFANLTLVGNASISLNDTSLTVENVLVAGTIADPVANDLVVEVFTPNGQVAGHSFFIGSNTGGQTAPGFLAAPDCGAVEPTDIGVLGFPTMHVLMLVNGSEGVPTQPIIEVPTLDKAALAGLVLLLIAAGLVAVRRFN